MIKRSVLLVFIFASACSHNPYRHSNKMYKKEVRELSHKLQEKPVDYFAGQQTAWAGTPNFDLRKPNFIIIHHTAQNSCPETLNAFTTRQSKVSAHYVICKDGTVHHMLNDYLRAWQAGISKWGNNTDINSSSIGIELDNNGFEPFTDQQISSLLVLLDTLKNRYSIPAANFIGHSDIAPGRKVDPNWRFPWKLLADHGFGNWYDDTTNVQLPTDFNPVAALKGIGYNMKDTLAVIASFRRHWLQDTVFRYLDSPSQKILYNLSLKYQ